jgi:hypothetical protein
VVLDNEAQATVHATLAEAMAGKKAGRQTQRQPDHIAAEAC